MKKFLCTLAIIAGAVSANAATIQFNLQGIAGPGLLPGNEPGSITGGTGGEIGSGITFDDVALTLTINVGWGSSQGFTDLSSNSNNSHIHGPTTNNNGLGFTQTAGVSTFNSVQANLTRSSSLPSGGTISQTVGPLTAGQQTDLYNGKFYVNIHTVTNGGGELRGFIVPVPEPSTAALAMVGILGLLARRRPRNA